MRKGKKQMPPIPHFRFSPSILDTAQPLKARCPTAMPDLAPRPRALPQHLKLKYGKVGAGPREACLPPMRLSTEQ